MGYLQCHVYHTDTRESSVGSQYRLAQLGRNTARHPEETGKMEEAAVLEKKQINIFFHFPQNIGRMEDARQKKIQKTWQKIWKCWENERSCGRRK